MLRAKLISVPLLVSPRWPGDLADADLPPNTTSPGGGLWSSDVPAAFRNQHSHVSGNITKPFRRVWRTGLIYSACSPRATDFCKIKESLQCSASNEQIDKGDHPKQLCTDFQ